MPFAGRIGQGKVTFKVAQDGHLQNLYILLSEYIGKRFDVGTTNEKVLLRGVEQTRDGSAKAASVISILLAWYG